MSIYELSDWELDERNSRSQYEWWHLSDQKFVTVYRPMWGDPYHVECIALDNGSEGDGIVVGAYMSFSRAMLAAVKYMEQTGHKEKMIKRMQDYLKNPYDLTQEYGV